MLFERQKMISTRGFAPTERTFISYGRLGRSWNYSLLLRIRLKARPNAIPTAIPTPTFPIAAPIAAPMATPIAIPAPFGTSFILKVYQKIPSWRFGTELELLCKENGRPFQIAHLGL